MKVSKGSFILITPPIRYKNAFRKKWYKTQVIKLNKNITNHNLILGNKKNLIIYKF